MIRRSTRLHVMLLVVLLSPSGCSVSRSDPATIIRDFSERIERDDLSAAYKLLSQRSSPFLFLKSTEDYKQLLARKGGIKGVVVKDQPKGGTSDRVNVIFLATFGNGSTQQGRATLVREGDAWKLASTPELFGQ